MAGDRWGGRDWSRASATRVGQLVVATIEGRLAGLSVVTEGGAMVTEIVGQPDHTALARRADNQRYNQRRRDRMRAARLAAKEAA